MILATLNGKRTRAWPGLTAAHCPGCTGDVIAKCGPINAWHWAHEVAERCGLELHIHLARSAARGWRVLGPGPAPEPRPNYPRPWTVPPDPAMFRRPTPATAPPGTAGPEVINFDHLDGTSGSRRRWPTPLASTAPGISSYRTYGAIMDTNPRKKGSVRCLPAPRQSPEGATP